MMMINRNTRWLEVTKLYNVMASTVVSGFLRTWVSRYGVPVTVITASCGQQCVRNYTFSTGPLQVIILSQTG